MFCLPTGSGAALDLSAAFKGFRFETQNLPELHLLHARVELSSSLAGTLPGLVSEADPGDCDLFTGRAAAGYYFGRSGTDDGGI